MAGSDNSAGILLEYNNASGGRGLNVPKSASGVISLIPRNTFEITTANTDVVLTLNPSSDATKGAYSYFKLKKGGLGNAIIRSTSPLGKASLVGGFYSITISVNGEGFGLIDLESSYTVDRDTRLDLSSNYIPVDIVSTSSAPITIAPATYNNIDTSNFEGNILLPDVVTGNLDWYWVTLKSNGNHCNISTVGGIQLIGSELSQSLSTEGATLLITSNRGNGYNIFLDTRGLKKIIRFTEDISLLSGFENGVLYVGAPADGVLITATIKDWDISDKGASCYFTKDSGEGSTVRVRGVNELLLDESIVNNDAQFELQATDTKYKVGQDNRPTPQDSSITLYALSTASVIVPYNKATVKNSEVGVAVDAPTGAISGLGQLVGAFISEEGIILGTTPASNIYSVANWRRISGNGTAIAYAEIYKYSLGVETLLATTNQTIPIESATYIQNNVYALIPETTWISTDRILIKAYMDKVGVGTNPSYELELEGDKPARVIISLPFSTISHQNLPDSGAITHAEIDAFINSYNADTSLDPNDLFVAKFGNDSTAVWNDRKRPWETWQAAMDAAKPGDWVRGIGGGIYDENLQHPFGVNIDFNGATIMPTSGIAFRTKDPNVGDGNVKILGLGKIMQEAGPAWPTVLYLINSSGAPQRLYLDFDELISWHDYGCQIVNYEVDLKAVRISGGYDEDTFNMSNCQGVVRVNEISDYNDNLGIWNGSRTLRLNGSELSFYVDKIISDSDSDNQIEIGGNSKIKFYHTDFSLGGKYTTNFKLFVIGVGSEVDFYNCNFTLDQAFNFMLLNSDFTRVSFHNCNFIIDTETLSGLDWLFRFESMTTEGILEFISCKSTINQMPADMTALIDINNQAVKIVIKDTELESVNSGTRVIDMMEEGSTLILKRAHLQNPNPTDLTIFAGDGIIHNVGSSMCGTISPTVILKGQTIEYINEPLDL